MEALSLIGDLGLNVVDEKEIARCKDMFVLYDEDKDGKLTYAELLTCVRCCGRNPSVDEFKEMVQVIDTKLVRLSRRRRPLLNSPWPRSLTVARLGPSLPFCPPFFPGRRSGL